MNSQIFIRLVTFICVLLFCQRSTAQDCDQVLESASNLYKEGNLTEVIQSVQSCTNSDDPVFRLNAHRLQAIAYLGLNERNKARESAVEMLKIDPAYKPSMLDDPAEFVKILNSVRVIPAFSIGRVVFDWYELDPPTG